MPANYFECKILAKKILYFKEKHNLTYQQIGDALGVDKSYIHRIVKMDSHPSLPVLIRLSRFMGVPLYSVFMPTDDLIREEFITAVKNRMEELKLDIESLSEKTGITPIRLMDILGGDSGITTEEKETLSNLLQIEEKHNYQEDKLKLLESIIEGLDLGENQKQNILKYIKDNLKINP